LLRPSSSTSTASSLRKFNTDAGVEDDELLAEDVAKEETALPAAPGKRLLAANAPPADLVGITEHGVLHGRYLRHVIAPN
jgi:hypothetical protein